MIVMPGIMRGRRTLFDGFVMDLMSSTFRATVPTTQTRTFQETHVYTGGTKWLLKANGFLGSTTAPEEPVLYNTSGTRLGIVLEPAATNLSLASQDFGNATYWTTSTSAIVANAITAPDGTLTADKLDETAGVFPHYVVQSPTLTAAAYTLSYYVKPAERAWCWIRTTGGTATYFNLSGAGAVGTLGHTSATIEALPNGWYRCAIVYTATVGGSIGIGPATADNTNNYNGVASNGIYVWGSQIEAGSVATSYIPTTTASVTRTADTCYRIVGPERSVGATEGTLYADVTPYVAATSYIAVMDNGADNDKAEIYLSGTSLRGQSVDGGASQADVSTITAVANTPIKVAFGFKANDFNAAANNTLGTLDTSGTLDTGFTHLRIGSRLSGNQFTGLFRKVKFWPTRLADATLQTLSNGTDASGATIDFDYSTGLYQYTPVNAGTTTTYSLATLISSGLMTLTGTPSAKWVRGSNGLLQQVAAGSLALEYDVNGVLLGCINTEPQRTNLATYSQDLRNTADAGGSRPWFYVGLSSLTPNATAGPDGNVTADLVNEDGASSGHGLDHGFGTVAAGTYTFSIMVKYAGRQWIQIDPYGAGSPGTDISWFDIQNGVLGQRQANCSASTITPYGNGFYLISATWTCTNASLTVAVRGASADNVSANYTGINGAAWYGTDGQLELGTYPSSRIPTTTATVTRNADVWTLNLGSWFDNSKWIVASKVYAPRANMRDGSTSAVVFTLEPASGTVDYVYVALDQTNRIDFLERSYSVTGAQGNSTSLAFPAVVRNAFGFSPSNAKASLNGTTQTLTGTPSPIQASLTRAGLGNWLAGTNPDQGSVYIQNIQILPIVPTQTNVNQYAGAA